MLIIVIMLSGLLPRALENSGDRLRLHLVAASDLEEGTSLSRKDFKFTLGLVRSEDLGRYLSKANQGIGKIARARIERGEPLYFDALRKPDQDKSRPTTTEEGRRPRQDLSSSGPGKRGTLPPCPGAPGDGLNRTEKDENVCQRIGLEIQQGNLAKVLNDHIRGQSTQFDAINMQLTNLKASQFTLENLDSKFANIESLIREINDARTTKIVLERTNGKFDLVSMFYDLFIALGVEPAANTGNKLKEMAINAADAFLKSVAETSGKRITDAVFDAVQRPASTSAPTHTVPPERSTSEPDENADSAKTTTPSVSIRNFELNGINLPRDAPELLEPIVAFAEEHTKCVVEVWGHADRVGAQSYNFWLSHQRAEAVKRVLGVRISPKRIRLRPRGEIEPVVQTADDVADGNNRRVEVGFECRDLATR